MSFLFFFWGFLSQWIVNIFTSLFSEFNSTGHWIDNIPQVIGYILFYIGFVKMQNVNPMLAKGKNAALITMLLYIIQMFIPLNEESMNAGNLIGILITLIAILSELYMVYHLCMGIAQIADDQLKPNLREIAHKRWKLFLYCQIIIGVFLLSGLLVYVTSNSGIWIATTSLLSLVAIVFNLIVFILMVTFTWKAHKELELPIQER